MHHGTVVQPTLMGMSLGPGHLLSMHLGALTVIGLRMALGDHRLVSVLALLASPHPGHITGIALAGE